MDNSKNVTNLAIIAVAFIFVFLVYKKTCNGNDDFVGRVPIPPIGGYGAYIGYPPYQMPGVYPTGQPMMYPQQLYPAKMPYYPEFGQVCKNTQDCGATGLCVNGSCTVKDKAGSVFNTKL